jgi:hypothetical protein
MRTKKISMILGGAVLACIMSIIFVSPPVPVTAGLTDNATVSPSSARMKGERQIDDIRGVRRGHVEEVVVACSGPVTIQAKRKDNSIIALFENVRNPVGEGVFRPAGLMAVQQITVSERLVRGVRFVGITIAITDSPSDGGEPFFQILPDRFCVFLPHTGAAGLAFWSARNGSGLSYEFADLGLAPVDLDGIARMADRDLKSDIPANTMFAVRHEEPGPHPVGPSAARAVDTVSASVNAVGGSAMVWLNFTKDRVNLRSEPSSATADNIIASLSRGTKVAQMEVKGQWRRVKLSDGTIGWVHGSMVVESTASTEDKTAETADVEAPAAAKPAVLSVEVPVVPVAKPPEPASLPVQPALVTPAPPADSASLSAATDSPTQASYADSAIPPVANMIVYHKFGRDPFVAISAQDMVQDGLVNAETSLLVGILYDNNERIALLEDQIQGGVAYALREGDPVVKGKLIKIQRDRVVFLLNEFGASHPFSLTLKKGKQE